MLMIIVLMVFLSACEKTDGRHEYDDTKTPSPKVAAISKSLDSAGMSSEEFKFACFLANVRHNMQLPPAYYDSEFVHIIGTETLPQARQDSVWHILNDRFYVTINDVEEVGQICYLQQTITSVEDFFSQIDPTKFDHAEITGNFSPQYYLPRFWDYDIFGVDIRKYAPTDTCHWNRWRMTYVCWIPNNPKMNKKNEDTKIRVNDSVTSINWSRSYIN